MIASLYTCIHISEKPGYLLHIEAYLPGRSISNVLYYVLSDSQTEKSANL